MAASLVVGAILVAGAAGCAPAAGPEVQAAPSARKPEPARPVAAKTRYAPPRILKKRAVARATLFTGSGPDGGGVVGAAG